MEEKNKSPIYEEAEKDYIGGMKYKDIAEKYNVSINTVKSWKTRYSWIKIKKGTHTNSKKVCTQNKSMQEDKKNAREPVSEAVKEVMKNEELTEKQKLFCIYYSKCFNQTKAYLKAYECDYITANSNASKLMVNTSIKAMINELTQVTMNKEILKRGLLQKYIDIAFADIKDYMSFGTETIETQKGEFEISVVKLKDSVGVDGTLITEVSQGKDGIKIKLADKMKAMDFLSKHTNLLNDDEKAKLELEYMQLRNDKLSIENKKATGEDLEIEDTEELENEIYGSNQEENNTL